jgi:quinol monooxygenase YgiN
MLKLRMHMEFTPDRYDEAAAALRSIVGPVRSEPGCRATRLLRNVDGGCALTWVEEWRSVSDFERHLQASAFRRLLAVMELASEKPEFEVDDVSSRRGFELVEELLQGVGTDHRDDPGT